MQDIFSSLAPHSKAEEKAAAGSDGERKALPKLHFHVVLSCAMQHEGQGCWKEREDSGNCSCRYFKILSSCFLALISPRGPHFCCLMMTKVILNISPCDGGCMSICQYHLLLMFNCCRCAMFCTMLPPTPLCAYTTSICRRPTLHTSQ